MKVKFVEERRYVNAAPREDGAIKFVGVGGIGVAMYGKYIVLRMPRGGVNVYVYYELLGGIDKNALADQEFIKRLAALEFENEIIKKRIEELKEFADKLEELLRGLPVVITVMSVNNKSHGHVEVKLVKQVDNAAFQLYVSTCKSLNMKFDPASRAWIYVPPWSQYAISYISPR